MHETELMNLETIRNLDNETINMINTIISEKREKNLSELLVRDEKGKICQSNENCQLILQMDNELKGAIKLNELTGRLDIVKEMKWKRNGASFTDNDMDNIITYIEKHYGIHSERNIERAVRVTARENSYHPIKELLKSLEWDGENRIDNVLTRYLGVEPTELVIESLKVFMLGAVERVFNPGCKFEYMLCFVGGQGAGKSTFLRFLALNDLWFTDDIKHLDDSKIYEHLQGHWIIEMPEMLAILHAKMVEETKSFISRLSDNFRLPYDKYSMDHPRQCVFAGTSNRVEFLPPDKSGNRRFLPIEVRMENAQMHLLENEVASRHYFIQLWAEIMDIYRRGNYKLTLSKEMQIKLIEEQEKYMPEDPMETDIMNYLAKRKPEYVCIRMLYVEALSHLSTDIPVQWESNAISEIMNHKFKEEYRVVKTHRFKEYGVQRGWVRIKEVEIEEIPF